jgi:hypothetical protein
VVISSFPTKLTASKAELVRQDIEQMCWRIHFDRVYLAVYFERNGCQQFDRQRRLKPLSILDAADLAGVVGRVGHIIEGEDAVRFDFTTRQLLASMH